MPVLGLLWPTFRNGNFGLLAGSRNQGWLFSIHTIWWRAGDVTGRKLCSLFRTDFWACNRTPTYVALELAANSSDCICGIVSGYPSLGALFVIYFELAGCGLRSFSHAGGDSDAWSQWCLPISPKFIAPELNPFTLARWAALSLGMTPVHAMQYVVLPQAIQTMVPPITNFAIVMVKDTALVFTVGVVEIMALARQLVTETLQSAVIYLMAGCIYLCITIPMARVAVRLERSKQAWQ